MARSRGGQPLPGRRQAALVGNGPGVSGRFRSLVLCYHAVSDSWPDQLAVPPSLFEQHLRSLLRRGYRSAPGAQVVEGRRGLLHVTFDDAYTSVANAVPILERLNVAATVFACSGYATDGRPLAVPELATQAEAFPEELATMNWDALRGLAEGGIDIGSHTVSHPHLTQLSDSELDRELTQSRERLEDELRRPCPLVAYPYGEEDERVRAAARRAGYRAAFALRSNPTPIDRFALPRVDLYRRDRPLRAWMKTAVLPRAPRGLLEASRRRASRGRRRA